MRIFTISDLHIDYSENQRWVEGISTFDYQEDILILAGDITHHLKNLTAIKDITSLIQRSRICNG